MVDNFKEAFSCFDVAGHGNSFLNLLSVNVGCLRLSVGRARLVDVLSVRIRSCVDAHRWPRVPGDGAQPASFLSYSECCKL